MKSECAICSVANHGETLEIELDGVRDTLCFNCLLWHCFFVHQVACEESGVTNVAVWQVVRQLDSIFGCVVLTQPQEGQA